VINKNPKMTGGHFIVITKVNDEIIMINPRKTEYEEKKVSYDFIINICKNYGSWRILIK
jgi:hypothetical protein